MTSLEVLFNELENLEAEEISKGKNVLNSCYTESDVIDYDGAYELKKELNKLEKAIERLKHGLSEITNSDNPDYIKGVAGFVDFRHERDKISERYIQTLENISNSGISQEYEDTIKNIISMEEKLRELEKDIEDELILRLRKKALNQAEEIMGNRPKVVFNKNTLLSFIRFGIKATYHAEEMEILDEDAQELFAGDQVIETKEAYGAFRYSENQEGDFIIREFIPCKEYRFRSRSQVAPSEEFVERVENSENLMSTHFHPPGGQKSHSKEDSMKNKIGILGIPQSEKLCWVVAQFRKERHEYGNLRIKVNNGKVPQASLNKYNEAIIKALAYSKIEHDAQQRVSSWNNYGHKLMDDNGLLPMLNKGGENQWIQYLDTETY